MAAIAAHRLCRGRGRPRGGGGGSRPARSHRRGGRGSCSGLSTPIRIRLRGRPRRRDPKRLAGASYCESRRRGRHVRREATRQASPEELARWCARLDDARPQGTTTAEVKNVRRGRGRDHRSSHPRRRASHPSPSSPPSSAPTRSPRAPGRPRALPAPARGRDDPGRAAAAGCLRRRVLASRGLQRGRGAHPPPPATMGWGCVSMPTSWPPPVASAGREMARAPPTISSTSEADPRAGRGPCAATLLPSASFYLRLPRFAPARALVDAARRPRDRRQPAAAFTLHAVRDDGGLLRWVSFEEALAAATVNAARSLDVQAEVGSLEAGQAGRLVVLRSPRLLTSASAWAVRPYEGRRVVRCGRQQVP